MTKDLDYYRKEYFKQRKIEKFVNSRVLVRPNIKKWQVVMVFSILPFLLGGTILASIMLTQTLLFAMLAVVLLIIIIVEIYLRFCLIILVKYYQSIAKEETRRRCCCIPSCSEYAIIALKRLFPLILSLLKIRKRLYVTCNGDGYKIDFPFRKMGEEFEGKLQ